MIDTTVAVLVGDRLVLTALYNFEGNDIVVMIDDVRRDDKFQPTKHNIVSVYSGRPLLTRSDHWAKMREIRNLVRGVRRGDQLVFYCES